MQQAVEAGLQCAQDGLGLLGEGSSSCEWVASLPAVHISRSGEQSDPVCVCTLRGTGQLHESQFELATQVTRFLGTSMLGVGFESQGAKTRSQLSSLADCVSSLTSLAVGEPSQFLKTSLSMLLRLLPSADSAQLGLWDARKHQIWLLDTREHTKEDGALGQWGTPGGLLEAGLKRAQGTTALGPPGSTQAELEAAQGEHLDPTTTSLLMAPLRQSVAAGSTSHLPGALLLRGSVPGVGFSEQDVSLLECFAGLFSSALRTSREHRSHVWAFFGFSLQQHTAPRALSPKPGA